MGWQNLLKRHGLDITKADLAAELVRELTIDRGVPGFEDFTLAGQRGVEAGFPAASLLYHAFASPDVHPTATGEPATSVHAYPTLAELDAVENYIFACVLSILPNLKMSSSECSPTNTGHGQALHTVITRIWFSPALGSPESEPSPRPGTVPGADFGAIHLINRELP